MIDLSQRLIASLILSSAACGVCLGVLYELVRFARCLMSPTRGRAVGIRAVFAAAVTFITDLLFLILFAVCGILITFEICRGVFRGIVYVSMAVGLLIYRCTLGRLTARIVRWIAITLKKILKRVLGILILPLRKIKFLIVKLYTLTIGKIIGRIKERMILKRLAGLLDDEAAENDGLLPTREDVDKEKGYRREGRISFGGKG